MHASRAPWAFGALMPSELAGIRDSQADDADADGPCAGVGGAQALVLGQWAIRHVWPFCASTRHDTAVDSLSGDWGAETAQQAREVLGILCDNGRIAPDKQNIVSMLAVLVAVSAPGRLQKAVLAAMNGLAGGTTLTAQEKLFSTAEHRSARSGRTVGARQRPASSWCGCFGGGNSAAAPPAHRIGPAATGPDRSKRQEWRTRLCRGLAAGRQLVAVVHAASQAIDWTASQTLQGARQQLAASAGKPRTRWFRTGAWERVRTAAMASLTAAVAATTGFSRSGLPAAASPRGATPTGSSCALFSALAARLDRLGLIGTVPSPDSPLPDSAVLEAALRGAALLCEHAHDSVSPGTTRIRGATAVSNPDLIRAASVSPAMTTMVRVLCEASWASADLTDCKPGRGGLPDAVVGRWKPLSAAATTPAATSPSRVSGASAVMIACGWSPIAAQAITSTADDTVRPGGRDESVPTTPRLDDSHTRVGGDTRFSEHSIMQASDGLQTTTVRVAVREEHQEAAATSSASAGWTNGALMMVGGSAKVLLAAHSLFRATGDRATLKFVSSSGYGGALESLLTASQRFSDEQTGSAASAVGVGVSLFGTRESPLRCAPIMRPWLAGPAGLLAADAGEGHGPRKEVAAASIGSGWVSAVWAKPDVAGTSTVEAGGALRPASDRWAVAAPEPVGEAMTRNVPPFSGEARDHDVESLSKPRVTLLKAPSVTDSASIDSSLWGAVAVCLPAIPAASLEADAMTLTAAACATSIAPTADTVELIPAAAAAAAAAGVDAQRISVASPAGNAVELHSSGSVTSPSSDDASQASAHVAGAADTSHPFSLVEGIATTALILVGSNGKSTASLVGAGATALVASCSRSAGGNGTGELIITPLRSADAGSLTDVCSSAVVTVRFRQCIMSGTSIRLVLTAPLPATTVSDTTGYALVLGARCQRQPLLVASAASAVLRPSERPSSSTTAMGRSGASAPASNTAAALAAIGWAAGACLVARAPPRLLLDCRSLNIHLGSIGRVSSDTPHPFFNQVSRGWDGSLLATGAESMLAMLDPAEMLEAAGASDGLVVWPPRSISSLEQVPLPPSLERWLSADAELLSSVFEAEGDDLSAAALGHGQDTKQVETAVMEASAAMLCREAWSASHSRSGAGFIPAATSSTHAAAASDMAAVQVCAMGQSGIGWRDCAFASGLRAALGGDEGARALSGWGIGGVELADALADGAGNSDATKPLVLEEQFRVRWATEFAEQHHPVRAALERFVFALPPAGSAAFLHFVTGSRLRPPAGAEALLVETAGSMAVTDSHWRVLLQTLPQAHTCTNTLELPDYQSAVIALAGSLGVDASDAIAVARETDRITTNRLHTALSMGGGSAYGLDDDDTGGGEEGQFASAGSLLLGHERHSNSNSTTANSDRGAEAHARIRGDGSDSEMRVGRHKHDTGVTAVRGTAVSTTSSGSAQRIGRLGVAGAGSHSPDDALADLLAEAGPASHQTKTNGRAMSSTAAAAATATIGQGDWRTQNAFGYSNSAHGHAVAGVNGSGAAQVPAPWERPRLPQSVAEMARGSSNGTHDTTGDGSMLESVIGRTASTGCVMPLTGAVESRESERTGHDSFLSSESGHAAATRRRIGAGRSSGIALAGRNAMGGAALTGVSSAGVQPTSSSRASHNQSPPRQVGTRVAGLQRAGEQTMVQALSSPSPPRDGHDQAGFAAAKPDAVPWSSRGSAW